MVAERFVFCGSYMDNIWWKNRKWECEHE